MNQTAGTLSLTANDGSQAMFATKMDPKATFELDSKLRADTVSPTNFKGTGDQVLVYYYGVGTDRTAVALKDLGKGQYTSASGTVTEFDKHSRMLTLKLDASGSESFYVEDRAVADTAEGLIEGRKFNPHKGVPARVVATLESGKETAVFVRARQTY